jgi:hypothetical protein
MKKTALGAWILIAISCTVAAGQVLSPAESKDPGWREF